MMVTALRYINNVPHLDILTGALLNADVFLCSKIKQFLIHLFIVNVKLKTDRFSLEKSQPATGFVCSKRTLSTIVLDGAKIINTKNCSSLYFDHSR
ncbi:unnamed protein product [Rotaria sordida]|uniref:Uncharacterized protein n=1 Tax=Rotaria sordida TaxID=392033 RepID=A0A819TYZ1_9BILA|nr:unnamed protein product [Rotaria sordida]CAF3982331.1 unnamed protein product [Rotaria sordida]CAF4083037.1 unnamed protein product [Rotaria sordida]